MQPIDAAPDTAMDEAPDADPDPTTSLRRLRTAYKRLATLRPAVERGRPWPLAEHFGTEPEARWGPPEVLAHTAEMLPFWLGEIERILDAPEDHVPFGRVADDPLRLATIERDRSLPVAELFDRIARAVERYEGRLPRMTPAELGRTGLHPRRGEMSITAILDAFVVGHLEEHVTQLRTALGEVEPPARSPEAAAADADDRR
jgi:hypothetical protein